MEIGLTVGDSLERIDRLGHEYDFVELGIGEGFGEDGPADPDEVADRVAAVDCDLCVHLPFSQDLVTPVPEINDAIVRFLGRLLEWSGAAGAMKAVLHGTARDPHDTDLRERVPDQLAAIREQGADHGVEVVVENVGHQPRGLQLSVLAEAARDADATVCFDVGHAYMEDGHDGIERFLKKRHPPISHLHVHDARRRGDTHLPLGAGEIEYDLVVDQLGDFDGTVAIEVFTDDAPMLSDSHRRIGQHFGTD